MPPIDEPGPDPRSGDAGLPRAASADRTPVQQCTGMAWLAMKALAVFAVFGVLGIAVTAVLRHRVKGGRLQHVGKGAVAVGSAALFVGAIVRGATAMTGVDRCEPPPEIKNYAAEQAAEAAISIGRLDQVMTWSVSGIAIFYGRLAGADICYFEAHKYYLSTFDRWPLSRGSVFVGNVLLSKRLDDRSVDRILELSSHEVAHREQWSWATVIGGPLAFPVGYTVDNFFFPDAANHFERAAGLDEGGYDTDRTSPRLGWGEVAALAVSLAGIEIASLAVRRERHKILSWLKGWRRS
ncbi:hypothetical protein [Candidatus Amarobacter glycogenicus]|uniref:hypothetical protein n=1 Tax=Candidatus Amarobacter glycogenicus TaxID=3140699 RepID=UPI0031372AC6|nr:hypothetical protein [Dehalococcoidia bacterium]